MWVLILIVFAANGVTSTSAYFADEGACKSAMHAMAQEVGSLKNQAIIYVHCSEGASKQVSEQRQ